MEDYKCYTCNNFNPANKTCKKRINCPYDEDEEDEEVEVDLPTEVDLIPGYTDETLLNCKCGSKPVLKCYPPVYWVTCNNCHATTAIYGESPAIPEGAMNRAIKVWNKSQTLLGGDNERCTFTVL